MSFSRCPVKRFTNVYLIMVVYVKYASKVKWIFLVTVKYHVCHREHHIMCFVKSFATGSDLSAFYGHHLPGIVYNPTSLDNRSAFFNIGHTGPDAYNCVYAPRRNMHVHSIHQIYKDTWFIVEKMSLWKSVHMQEHHFHSHNSP